MGAAAVISHLQKAYGDVVAVDDVSLTVAEGEIFGILGPNGAGKTTTVECAIGLRTPDAGSVTVHGLDPFADRAALHETVGVQLQASALPGRLRVGEILDLYHSFYPAPEDVADLVDALGLREKLRDRLAVIDHGRVVATGTPAALTADAGGAKVVRFAPSGPIGDHVLTDLPEVETVKADNGEVVVTGRGELVNAVILTLAAHDVTAHDVRLTTPTLEDAFVRLTGPR